MSSDDNKGRFRGSDSTHPHIGVNPISGSVIISPEMLESYNERLAKSMSSSGMVSIPNKKIDLQRDFLYHLGLDTSMPLREWFADTKFVMMGGSADRARKLACKLVQRLKENNLLDLPSIGYKVTPIGKTERFSLYKVGQVISVNHGMGMPSMSILLHELVKLLHYAGAEDVTFIRIGTSGGLGLEGGTVVVGTHAVDPSTFEPTYKLRVMDKFCDLPSHFNESLAKEILASAPAGINCVLGKTIGTDDFYEGQGRMDGAFCDYYSEEDKIDWLRRAYEAGVRNIEMECNMFASFCLRAGIPAALINTVLLNRLNGDQVTSTPEELGEFSNNAQEVAVNFVCQQLVKKSVI